MDNVFFVLQKVHTPFKGTLQYCFLLTKQLLAVLALDVTHHTHKLTNLSKVEIYRPSGSRENCVKRITNFALRRCQNKNEGEGEIRLFISHQI